MSRDQEPFQDEKKSWGNVQGGRSGISSDSVGNRIEKVASSDDDIIELVDVVREGDPIPEADEALSSRLNQEEVLEKEEDFLDKKDTDLSDFSLPLDETAQEKSEADVTEPDLPDGRFESSDFNFETPEGLEEPAGEEMSDISMEDLDLITEGLGLEVKDETTEETSSISQERLEAVITHTVTEVVERVVRETVAEVAERVIQETIESLKQSLETKPE